MKKRLSEIHTPGGNFYSGRNLGTSGADANFSSYMSNKKAYPPDEYYDEDDEGNEMRSNILNKRKRNRDGSYRLEDTLARLSEDSQTGVAIEKAISDLLQGAADEATGEAAGIILAVPVIIKNMYELYSVGGEIDDIFERTASQDAGSSDNVSYNVTQQDIDQLNALKETHASDLTEVFTALIRALPLPAGIDSAAAGFINQISTPFATKFSEGVNAFMSRLPDILVKVINLSLGYTPTGILMSAMKRIYKITNLKPGLNTFSAASGDLVTDRPPGIDYDPSQQIDGFTPIGIENPGSSTGHGNFPPPDEFKKQMDQVFKQTIAESLKYKSLETLLQEFDEGAVCEQCGGHGGMHESDCTSEAEVTEGGCDTNEMHCTSETDVNEMNAGGVPGVGMKLGHNPDGTPTTYAQLKKLRKKQDVYQITENQNWNHMTLGRIKFK